RRKTDSVAYKLERVERYLQRWLGMCAICMAVDGRAEEHKWKACPTASKEQ
ncbi:hypothetical protein BKA63DRAFT_386964, partial [Paraphoma chrysanthemicola]